MDTNDDRIVEAERTDRSAPRWGRRRAFAGLLAFGAGAAVVAAVVRDRPPSRVESPPPGASTSTERWQGPDAIRAVERELADGMLIQASLARRWISPSETSPLECFDPLVADVVASGVDRQLGGRLNLPDPPAGGASVRLLAATEYGLERRLGDGSIDPRVRPTTSTTSLQTPTSPGGLAPSWYPAPFAVAVGADITVLEVTGQDGRTDRADAVDGFAVAGFAPAAGGSIVGWRLTFADGTTIAGDRDRLGLLNEQVQLRDGTSAISPAAEMIRAGRCAAESTYRLPRPGPEQPEAGAEVAVREVVTAVADGRRPAQDRAQLTDDPARMLRLVGELDAELTEQSKTIGATATDVVFLDRNTALVAGSVQALGTTVMGAVGVKVVRSDGRWLVTWRSICALTSMFDLPACEQVSTRYPTEVFQQLPASFGSD